jgi:ABC-type sulfate transport system substrate-binding protein
LELSVGKPQIENFIYSINSFAHQPTYHDALHENAPTIFALALTGIGFLLFGEAHAQKTLLNVSYDPTRELYKAFNPVFVKHWQAKSGNRLH